MARLPHSTTRLEVQRLNLRNEKLPVRFEHDVRDINDHMDDIVYNAIDVIQERANENDLRTFYYNLMSNRNWDNNDFADLIGLVADIIDIAVSEDRFRDVRDAIIPVVEEVVTIHIAATTEEFRDLQEFIPRNLEREFDRAIDLYERYMKGVATYRRNGNRVPTGRERSGGRDRDDRGGRDRDRDRGRNDRDRGSSRRDQWDRGAVRQGVRGSPRRSISGPEGRFGNTDQSDRFDDTNASASDTGRGRDDRNDNRNDRGSERNTDRFENAPSSQTRRAGATVQRMPGRSRDSDIEDALARENSNKGSNMNAQEEQGDGSDQVVMVAKENLDAWLPTPSYPHPLAFNHSQDLLYIMDSALMAVIPRIVPKDRTVNYYDHASMAFGGVPKDMNRFEEGNVVSRSNKLHEALLNPSETFTIDGADGEIIYHNRLDFTEENILSYGLKEAILRVGYRRFAVERSQVNGDNFHHVELGIGRALIIESMLVTSEEFGLLEELRATTSFVKLAEKMRKLSKSVRPEVFLQLDNYLTTAVNHMLRQNMSIPVMRMTNFTEDWLELFEAITKEFGEGYRDAINTYQERELRKLFHHDNLVDAYVLSQVPTIENMPAAIPFAMAMPTKIISVNEVSFNLDIDMVPGVASQLLPEANPFFHDLAQELLSKDAEKYGRFFINTSDLRVIEVSRSFMTEKAVLVRVIK